MKNFMLALASSTLGGLMVVAFAFGWLSLMPIARGAECSGQIVTASWYGTESGNHTANGERFDGKSMTAAHRTLPFGTKLRVTYRGKSVVVRVNDRGPYAKGRGLDLSRAAAAKLGMIEAGVARVCVERD